nr:DUF6152 family protein [Pseudomonas gessardii]
MVFSLVLLGFTAPIAFAHHSYSAFDMARMVEIVGTVGEVQYKNPHVWLFVDVQTGDKTETWAIEAGGPNILMRQGWMANTLKPGDRINVQLAPMKDETKAGGALQALRLPDGKVIGAWK